MACLTLLNASLAFGHVPLLDRAQFSLEMGERVGLIGRNGAGKSSLLSILAGWSQPDEGSLQVQQGLRIRCVAQEAHFPPDATVYDTVRAGLGDVLTMIEAFSRGEGDLNALQTAIEAQDGWHVDRRVTETLQRLQLDGQALLGTCSGGVQKRVALAQALVTRPQVLLLDEPTNHLDLDAIRWLESLLVDFHGAVVFITHDRAFLDAVATRIVELDRGHLHSYVGNYARYLELQQAQAEREAVTSAKADKLLAQEEVWIRKGVEARRTRSQSRVERLKGLRQARAQRREQLGQVRMDIDAGVSSGKLVAELTDVSLWFDAPEGARKTIAQHLTTTILRGEKLALIGPNGAGKTSLLKLILGEIEASSGRVRRGTRQSVAYFDQMRAQLDLDATLEDFVSPGSEWIEIGTRRQHVKSYLGDFLFSPARAASPVRSLSGGERNRLLLARLFARPANVLVLDEPTNDLDLDTLEMLEDLLQQYEGTVFLVSHDRAFVDAVATHILAFEGHEGQPGLWREFEGNVQDWLIQSERSRQLRQAQAGEPNKSASLGTPTASAPAKTASPEAAASAKPRTKLSYKEQRELEELPTRIDALETEQAQIRSALADGSLFVTDADRAQTYCARDAEIEAALMLALERWEALSNR
ncbi:MAG: ATP-binding cassette domain-containing protein [Betaproteobacteria bacterium]|jgi:ABC transport system ATP-binding/permease protein|nr:ATP-binding cassette domain-containing protein [Betaproteobacteria bacterium]NBP45009.1 ATP-binding cassette domain-containing protein [Betaproteobacteria bacterium]